MQLSSHHRKNARYEMKKKKSPSEVNLAGDTRVHHHRQIDSTDSTSRYMRSCRMCAVCWLFEMHHTLSRLVSYLILIYSTRWSSHKLNCDKFAWINRFEALVVFLLPRIFDDYWSRLTTLIFQEPQVIKKKMFFFVLHFI